MRDYWQCGLRRLIGTFRYALQDRIEEKLPYVRVPTLVVRGGKDPIVPQRWCEEAVRLLPQGRLVVIPGAGHTVNYNSPGNWRVWSVSSRVFVISSQGRRCRASRPPSGRRVSGRYR